MDVFVYGTLRPGQPNYGLLEGEAIREVTAVAPGLRLRDFGPFPYAEPAQDCSVTGTLCTVSSLAAGRVLQRLDYLEGYRAARPQSSHYVRREWPVIYRDSQQRDVHVSAWLYLAGPRTDLGSLPIIVSGDWIDRAGKEDQDREQAKHPVDQTVVGGCGSRDHRGMSGPLRGPHGVPGIVHRYRDHDLSAAD